MSNVRWYKKFLRLLALFLTLSFVLTPVAQAKVTITYLHNDMAGSPVAATDEAGNVLWRESYQPFGEEVTKPVAAQDNRQFFHGKPYDRDTQLSYFGARYYDPVVGRFMGIDPAGFDEANPLHSFNRYAYGNNNPYKYRDPDGRFGVLTFLPLFAAVDTDLAIMVGGSFLASFAMAVNNHNDLSQMKFAVKSSCAVGCKNESAGNGSGEQAQGENAKQEGAKTHNDDLEQTPETHPENFESVRGKKGKRNTDTGEVWEKDMFHKDHWEVYKNKKQYDKGERDRAVWGDGRLKKKF